MSRTVDQFVRDIDQWHEETKLLRSIILETRLDEDLKWGKPCYSADGNNIAIIQPFKASLALMFFKGTLLKDPKGLLCDVGPNSRAGRRFEFSSIRDISKHKSAIKAYIKEAVALEKAGLKIERRRGPEPLPEELEDLLERKPRLEAAFAALTRGRQRAYALHIGAAKQSSTRMARIEKCIPDIMAGKGLNGR